MNTKLKFLKANSPAVFSALKGINSVVSWISFFASIWMIFTWILRKVVKDMVHLDETVLYFSICALVLSFCTGPLTTAVGYEYLLCRNKYEYNFAPLKEGGHVVCGVQGFLFQFFSLALISWWIVNVVKLFGVVVYPQGWGKHFTKKNTGSYKKIELILNLVIWTVCFSLALMAVLTHRLGALRGGVMCFLQGARWGWNLLLIPLLVALAIIIPLMSITLYHVYKITKKVSRPPNWHLIIRFICLILFLFVNFVILFANQVNVSENTERWTQNYLEAVLCKTSSPNPDACPEPKYPDGTIMVLSIFLVSAEGLIITLIFGFQKSNFLLWKRFFQNKFRLTSDDASNKSGDATTKSGDVEMTSKSSAEMSAQQDD